MLRTEAIKVFLNKYTHADLAQLYNYNMELQVLVSQLNGERVNTEYKGKKRHKYTDGINTWSSFRIPWNSMTEPTYEDRDIDYDLTVYAEGIGMTGWDWYHKVSKWVGYDYDAITGHSDRHSKKLTDDQIRELEIAISDIPWVTLRQSTGGKGRHIWVFVNDIPTANHDEHAALARAILSKMSGEVGYDFNSKVDIVGGNLWVWHKKLQESNGEGLKLLKSGDVLEKIPPNWRDHIDVIKGKKKKTTPVFVDPQENTFNELSGQYSNVPLDDEHKRLITWLNNNDLNSWWENDHHMLVTHTAYLAKAHQELGLKGIFKTTSQGTEYGSDYNAFCFPIRNGAWSVRRYGKGGAEAETWTQDTKGFTRCYLNRAPDFDTACRASDGNLNDKDGYVFPEAELAINAVGSLGGYFEVPVDYRTRKTILRRSKSDKLVVELPREEGDNQNKMRDLGFNPEGKMTKVWQKVFPIHLTPPPTETETQDYDHSVRFLITEEGDEYGWAALSEGSWKKLKLENVKLIMNAFGENDKEAKIALGALILKPWRVVNHPFQDEYLEGRRWNMKAAQFAVLPNKSDSRFFPTWMKILNHIGTNLNKVISNNTWCKNNDILTGADYLKCWCASIIQYPLEPLPYIFLWGPENSGKTVFAETQKLLFTHGVVRGDNSLINQSGFNAELEHAIIVAIEEVNLSNKNSPAFNRMKDWVTARDLVIHRKSKTPYLQPNSTHWVQTANDPTYCPVFPGDTRIVVIKVDEIPIEDKIPRRRFDELLRKEAPDFLGELLTLDLPEPIDRLNIPVLETEEKSKIQEYNMTPLELYMSSECHNIPGHMIVLKEFVEDFHDWLKRRGDHDEVNIWNPHKVARAIKMPYQTGRSRKDNYVNIINISRDANKPPLKKLVLRDKGHIYVEGDNV